MRGFQACKLFWITFLFAAVNTAASGQSIKLDKIDNCSVLQEVYLGLENRAKSYLTRCRPPKSSVERAIFKRSGLSENDLCLLDTREQPLPEDYSCTVQKWLHGGSLICFRVVDQGAIEEHKKNYRDVAPLENTYLNRARNCSISNGDASQDIPTKLPPTIAWLAKFDLGYYVALGKRDPSSSGASHGFATFDPELEPSTNKAIEYFSVLVNAPENIKKSEFVTRQDLTLEIDNSKEFGSQMSAAFAKAGVDVSVNNISIGYRYSTQVRRARATPKEKLIENIVVNVFSALEDEGFELLPENRYRKVLGTTKEEFIKRSTKSVPYGLRGVTGQKIGNDFYLLLKDGGVACTYSGNGAFGAMLFTYEPIDGDATDLGSVDLLLFGVQDCSSERSTTASRFENQLLGDLKNIMLDPK